MPNTCFILGATSAIATALARRLHADGWQLALAARNADKLAPLAAETGAATFVGDATDPAFVQSAVDGATQQLGQLGGAVNCVGSFLLKPAHLTSDADWLDTFAVNATTAFLLVRAAAKAIKGDAGGSIVLMSSVAGQFGLANHEAIAAAKAAVSGLTRSAAATYAPRNLRVNAVAPGLTDTPLTQKITANEASLKASVAMHPLNRVGQPEQVASAIAWLLSPEQSWVTGQVLGVDGGLGAARSRG